MTLKERWESVYATKSADQVSWFQPHAFRSVDIIERLPIEKSASIIDVGGGASMLVDDLLARGYQDLSVLDLSGAALGIAVARLGDMAARVRWIEGDAARPQVARHSIDVWHDRAVFHFLTDEADRRRYVDAVIHSVKPGGYVIVATFAEDGPEKCSGLPVQRYSATDLHGEFGVRFALLGHERELHQTPFGTTQSFVYCYCRVDNIPVLHKNMN